MSKQIALIVVDTVKSLKDLNDQLADGYKVVHSCAMPSSVAVGSISIEKGYRPVCLVIIEKEDEKSFV